MPVVGSMPTVASSRPRAAEMMPLIIDSASSAAINARARISTASISGALNFNAREATRLATRMTKSVEKVSPKQLEKSAVFKALKPCPFCAMGYPSKVVATAATSPGVLMRMAEIEPPYMPPLLMPTKKPMAAMGDM